MTEQAMIDIRKDMAEAAIRKKLEKGHKLGGISGVEKILQEFVEVSRLPEAFFKVLKGRDLCDLLAKATDSVVPGPTSDVMTPANSEDYVEELSEVRREGEQGIEGTQDEAKEGVKSPTYEDPERWFHVMIHIPNTSRFDLATASRCKEKESYISMKILDRNNLSYHVEPDRTIRLTWHNTLPDDESLKTTSTWFRIVKDADIKHDIAIGQGRYEDDEDDEDGEDDEDDEDELIVSERTQKLTIGQVERGPPMLKAADFAACFFSSLQDRWDHRVSAHKRQQPSDDKLDRDTGFRNKRPRIHDIGG